MSNKSDSKVLGIASDHAGFELKQELKSYLSELGIPYKDMGTNDKSSTDYPDYAHVVAKGILDGEFERGILVCGTGQGMAMSANRHPNIRAAVCSDTFTANASRLHNDANVLCIGSRVIGIGLAKDIVKAFLDAPFEGGRHIGRIEKIEKI